VGTVVLDTSVVLALFDPLDALHVPAATAARRRRDAGDDFLLPASALAELLVGAARQGQTEINGKLRLATAAFGPPHPLDETVAVATAIRRVRHRSLRLPDALVLATADVVSAQAVLTGDRRWRSLDPRIEVVD
jgi:predicted nucleic acid-binding protein